MQVLFETVFGAPWWLIIATAVYGVCWSVYGDLYEEGRANRRWVRDLRENAWLAWYRRVLGKVLNWLDDLLSPLNDGDGRAYRWEAAWSSKLLSICLIYSFIYPAMLILINLIIIQSLDRNAINATIYISFISSINQFSGLYEGIFFVIISVFCMIAAVLLRKGKLQLIIFNIVPLLIFSILEAYIFALSILILAIVLFIIGRYSRYKITLQIFYGILLLSHMATYILFNNIEQKYHILSTITILVVLPIINGIADFLSLGLTRYTLGYGIDPRQRVWAWCLFDVVGGLAILLLLGFSLIAWVAYVHPPDLSTRPLIRAQFADLRANSVGNWWLYLMLFTTLLPTALHLLFASFGGVLQLWPWLRGHIADGLEAGAKGDAVLGRWAVQWLCLAMTISVMAPVMVTGLLWVNTGAIGLGFLSLFEGFAALIGAV